MASSCSGHGSLVNGSCFCDVGWGGNDELLQWDDCQVDLRLQIIINLLNLVLAVVLVARVAQVMTGITITDVHFRASGFVKAYYSFQLTYAVFSAFRVVMALAGRRHYNQDLLAGVALWLSTAALNSSLILVPLAWFAGLSRLTSGSKDPTGRIREQESLSYSHQSSASSYNNSNNHSRVPYTHTQNTLGPLSNNPTVPSQRVPLEYQQTYPHNADGASLSTRKVSSEGMFNQDQGDGNPKVSTSKNYELIHPALSHNKGATTNPGPSNSSPNQILKLKQTESVPAQMTARNFVGGGAAAALARGRNVGGGGGEDDRESDRGRYGSENFSTTIDTLTSQDLDAM